MKLTESLVELFVAALETGADVVCYEHRTPGAHAALRCWAAVVQRPVKERNLGRINRGYYVELPSGGEIQIVCRAPAPTTIGAAS